MRRSFVPPASAQRRSSFLWIPTLAIAAVLAFAQSATAQKGPSLPLKQSRLDSTARDINFKIPLDSTVDGRWLGGRAQPSRWDLDGAWFYFSFDTLNQVSDPMPSATWWRISRDGKKVESVAAADMAKLPSNVRYTTDGTKALYQQGQRTFYWKRGSTPRLLAFGSGIVRGFPQWHRDNNEARWTSENSLFSMTPEDGVVRQLTAPFVARDEPRVDKNVAAMRKAQQDLFDFVKRSKEARDTAAARALLTRDARPVTTPTKLNETISQIQYSGEGGWVAYIVSPRVTTTSTTYSDYVNDSGFVFQRQSRPKVGQALANRRVMLVPADSLAVPDSVKAVAVDTSVFGKAAMAVQILSSTDGKHLVAEYQSVDYKDRWFLLIDPATGKVTRTLFHDHDDAWFGGAGLAEGWHGPSFAAWRQGSQELLITSEKSGYAHVYAVDVVSGQQRQITSGDWEVRSISLHRDGEQLWITAGIEHPAELHLYLVPMSGGVPQRVDRTGEGVTQAYRSPDDAVLAMSVSSPTRISDIYIQPVAGKAAPIQVTRGGSDAYWRTAWPAQDFIRFNDDKGKPVYARVFKPIGQQHSSRPAVLEIHGAGYTQGVWKQFGGSSAHGGMLYAQQIAARGGVYVQLDYRGSAGYGRDYRTDVYRSMGDRDVASAVSLIPVLQKDYNVNPDRVGLFGCSYGGFYTLMALFKHPGTFKAGVAQCSVTDWAHYNHGYTARILNGSPADDSTAYKASSPIYYAEGLRDRLLLQHGLIDGNVQYQDAVRLVQRLMELGKDFEFVTYPVDQHGWQTIWARRDSQRRMQKLFDEALFDIYPTRASN